MQLVEGLSACWQASTFGGESYDRFSISFDCGTSVSSVLFINGQRLRRAIEFNESIDDCKSELVESALLWFDASGIRKRVYGWKSIFVPSWENTKAQIVENWRASGLKVLSASYTIRHIRNQSAGNIRRIEAHVVLHERGRITDRQLTDIVKHIVHTLRTYRVKGSSFQGKIGFPLRPRYIWIRLYADDRRIRTLMSSGWSDQNLVLRAEWFSPLRNNGVIFVKNPQVVVNRIRIEYNPQLMTTSP